MASSEQLRQYLARWFQLGKQVVVEPSGSLHRPESVTSAGQYSPAFEACWTALLEAGLQHCYLENTNQSLAALACNDWEITNCSRCSMPVAQSIGGISAVDCPCSDQDNWPNLDLPTPQAPQNWTQHIQALAERLRRTS